MATQGRPVNAPSWIDLGSADLPGSVAFYTRLFGWEYHDYGEELAHYGHFLLGGLPVAGIAPLMSPDQPEIWTVYVGTDDALTTTAAALDHGASVIVPASAVKDQGQFAFFLDPTGAAVGVWQPEHHHGIEAFEAPGAPAWFELLTRDFAGALEFYAEAFGWDLLITDDSEEFRYAVQVADGAHFAGIMDASAFLPESVPGIWNVYFEVADADDCAELAVELGGRVSRPPQDTPFGRMASVTDPRGAHFTITAPMAAA